jgi:hypothetical protein
LTCGDVQSLPVSPAILRHCSASLYGTIAMSEGIGGVLGTMACGWILARIDSGKAAEGRSGPEPGDEA